MANLPPYLFAEIDRKKAENEILVRQLEKETTPETKIILPGKETPPAAAGTAAAGAQATAPSTESPSPPARTDAQRARSAASARTRCSSAA